MLGGQPLGTEPGLDDILNCLLSNTDVLLGNVGRRRSEFFELTTLCARWSRLFLRRTMKEQ